LKVSKRGAARWQVCREFHSKEWCDGAVVYDAASGDTHHLAPMAFQILAHLQACPCTQQELASRVLSSDSAAPDQPDQESLSTIESIVTDLSELGFIEPK